MAAHSIDTKWENNWDPKSLPLHGLYPVKSEKNTKLENTWDPKLLCVRTLIANEKLKTFD